MRKFFLLTQNQWIYKFLLLTVSIFLSLLFFTACGKDDGKPAISRKSDGSNNTNGNSGAGNAGNDGNVDAGGDSIHTGNDNIGTDVINIAPVIPNGYQEINAAKHNFKTCVKEDYSWTWNDSDGVTIYTQHDGSIPFVLMFRITDSDAIQWYNTHDYFAEDYTPHMQSKYGSDLISVGDTKNYSIGGKNLQGAEYHYWVQSGGSRYEVVLLRLQEMDEFGTVMQYTAKYLLGDGEETLKALDDAARYYTDTNASQSGQTGNPNVGGQTGSSSIGGQTTGKTFGKSNGFSTTDFVINPTISETMTYDHVETAWHVMDVPAGWQTYCTSSDPTVYTIIVQDPEVPERRIFFNIGSAWFKSASDYKTQANAYYYGTFWSTLSYLDDPSQENTAGYYQCFNHLTTSAYFDGLPVFHINNFNVVENFGTAPVGGDLLRGTYTNDSGREIQGIFMANWMDVSGGMALLPGAFYSGIFYSAPTEEFAEWEPVLNKCLASLQFTEDFRTAYYNVEKTTMETFAANTKVYNEITDMITSGWEARQSTYDLISGKQSDAALGYERVYDTETGEVYKAYNGFTSDYFGERYQSITDDMYSSDISGYIERVR